MRRTLQLQGLRYLHGFTEGKRSGFGRLIGGEPCSEIDRRVLESIGSGVVSLRKCYARLDSHSLPGLKLGKERKPYAAVRHLMKGASRPRGRGPRVALTATGSWWPRLRRRGGAHAS